MASCNLIRNAYRSKKNKFILDHLNPSHAYPEPERTANRQQGSLNYFKWRGKMSGLPRWKENPIRQEIHLAHLKHAKTSSTDEAL
jgi:hypothetical protein